MTNLEIKTTFADNIQKFVSDNFDKNKDGFINDIELMAMLNGDSNGIITSDTVQISNNAKSGRSKAPINPNEITKAREFYNNLQMEARQAIIDYTKNYLEAHLDAVDGTISTVYQDMRNSLDNIQIKAPIAISGGNHSNAIAWELSLNYTINNLQEQFKAKQIYVGSALFLPLDPSQHFHIDSNEIEYNDDVPNILSSMGFESVEDFASKLASLEDNGAEQNSLLNELIDGLRESYNEKINELEAKANAQVGKYRQDYENTKPKLDDTIVNGLNSISTQSSFGMYTFATLDNVLCNFLRNANKGNIIIDGVYSYTYEPFEKDFNDYTNKFAPSKREAIVNYTKDNIMQSFDNLDTHKNESIEAAKNKLEEAFEFELQQNYNTIEALFEKLNEQFEERISDVANAYKGIYYKTNRDVLDLVGNFDFSIIKISDDLMNPNKAKYKVLEKLGASNCYEYFVNTNEEGKSLTDIKDELQNAIKELYTESINEIEETFNKYIQEIKDSYDDNINELNMSISNGMSAKEADEKGLPKVIVWNLVKSIRNADDIISGINSPSSKIIEGNYQQVFCEYKGKRSILLIARDENKNITSARGLDGKLIKDLHHITPLK